MHDLIEKHLRRVKAMKAEQTHATYKTNLKQFDAWVDDRGYDITEMRALDLEEFFLEMKADGYAPNTIGSRFESVRGLYNTLCNKFEAIDENPFEDLRRRDYVTKNTRKHDESNISYVTPEEKEALCENVTSPKLRNDCSSGYSGRQVPAKANLSLWNWMMSTV